MKIVISGLASASALDCEEEITDPARLRTLDGLDYSTDRCSNYLDRSFEEIGVSGGVVRLAYDAGAEQLRVVTEYQAPRRLKPAELRKLVQETVGQWSDGIGEGEFRHRKKTKMDVNLYPRGRGRVRAEQFDDGKKVRKPRPNALLKALADRNRKEARRLLDEGVEVNGKDITPA